MKDFVSRVDFAPLERHGLISFEALWALQAKAVDAPNVGRGGWSEVSRLDFEGQGFYLKRQRNHIIRSLAHPLGELTFARELRNILRLQARGVPTVAPVFFAQRLNVAVKSAEGEVREDRAMLLTRALDGWRGMDQWLIDWADLAGTVRERLLVACGKLARQLHAAGMMHCCLYPKHIFARANAGTSAFEATLIDLEKARAVWWGHRDRCRDIDQFFRHAPELSAAEVGVMLGAYLDCGPDDAEFRRWQEWLSKRRGHKERR
ncbi:hypothetical protein AGMMS49960_02310 [Betaproteobacteria bacterium]|nr:hypothetical protein AGMMS49543_15320 [Betaproteobacteria bacterium]GHT98703.1 hypothetical protein AGMMS49960_02310 [Betaproteobacteria bacterium]GHU10867.1 hypothetical protein AGMMS50225_15180 [Betaproteobacteria bacterium]GHU18620.1 hypothetical protein AGMMS50243_08970 [Betaproteobacteria bacterium]